MLLFPHAKINLGLNVLRMRADGYRDIETVLVPIPLHDALEVIVDPAVPFGCLEYERTGLTIPGDAAEDLCVKAHGLLARGHALPGLRMHLHKRIPMGAGLGGGSSDGTHALIAINQLLHLGLSEDTLRATAAQLGSDCPFFVQRAIQLATGRGEVLRRLDLDLSGLWLLLVNPGIHVSTAEAYVMTPLSERDLDLADVLASKPMESWREFAPNNMERPIGEKYPAISEVIERLQDIGAAHAAMSGSGSTVFGLFRTRPAAEDWPQGYSSWLLPL